jgi:hypothetical protein
MTPEQAAILDLCDRVLALEVTLGLRQILSAEPALPELTHRIKRAEAAMCLPRFRSRRQPTPQFNSTRANLRDNVNNEPVWLRHFGWSA